MLISAKGGDVKLNTGQSFAIARLRGTRRRPDEMRLKALSDVGLHWLPSMVGYIMNIISEAPARSEMPGGCGSSRPDLA